MSSSLKSNICTNSLESSTHQQRSPLKKMKPSRSDETLSQITLGEAIKVKNYELFKEIGRGAFGSVYLGKKTNSEELFAIKSLDKLFLANTNKGHTALIEKEILRVAKHDNIIKLLSAFQTSSKLFFVLEYESNGTLQALIDNFGSLSYQLSKFYLAEMINVLDYLHNTLQVIHRDLKPENILLNENYHLKLIDFGSATIDVNHYNEKTKSIADICKQIKSRDELVGTPEYCSPEMLNKNTISSYSNDIWAFGCLMYLFFHGKTPFVGNCQSETLSNIKKGKYSISKFLPDDARDLLVKVLDIDQTKRLTLEQIKRHCFFKDITFETISTSKVPIIIDDISNSNMFKASKGDTSSTSDSWIINETKLKEKDFAIATQSPIVFTDSYFNFDKTPIDTSSSFAPLKEGQLIYEGIIIQVSWLRKESAIMKLYSTKELVLKTKEEIIRVNLNEAARIELFLQKRLLKITTDTGQSLKITSTIKELLKWKELMLSCIN